LQDFEGSDEAGKLTSLSIQTVTCSSMLLSDLEIGSENASLPIQKSAAMVESIYIYIYMFFWVFTLETVFMLETLKVFLFWGCLPRVESELVARNNVVVLEGSPLPLQSYDYIQLEYQGTQ
jgi:hypothetical protein